MRRGKFFATYELILIWLGPGKQEKSVESACMRAFLGAFLSHALNILDILCTRSYPFAPLHSSFISALILRTVFDSKHILTCEG